MGVTIDELHVADAPDAWRAVGFAVDEEHVCRVGQVRIRLGSGGGTGRGTGGAGITAWTLRDLPDVPDGAFDEVPTTASVADACAPATHPNGVTSIDHVVLMTPDLIRTTTALTAIGVDLRRERAVGAMRQRFFRLGEVILEVIGPAEAGEGPAAFWGITYNVANLDATAALLGEHLGRVKDAVQAGRRIATLRTPGPGISVATAFMTPHVR